MKRAIFSVLLGLLGLGILFTSAALAAPGQSLSSGEPVALLDEVITPTVEITPTTPTTPTTTTHPVAIAIGLHFSDVFSTTPEEIMALHQEGLGFGVIAKAYFAAQTLGITPTVLLDEFRAGTGWGVIMKKYCQNPGISCRGGNLGSIMSGHAADQPSISGAGLPPGQLKKMNNSSGVEDQSNGGKGHGNGKGKAKGHNK
jgi:hypothetical protein